MKNKVKNYYGVYENEIHDYKYYKIIMLEKTFEKTESGKSWKKNPVNVEEKEIEFKEYFNYLSSIEFFKSLGGYERIEKTYTYKGYIPTKLTSISPDKNIKIVRSFKIEKKEE